MSPITRLCTHNCAKGYPKKCPTLRKQTKVVHSAFSSSTSVGPNSKTDQQSPTHSTNMEAHSPRRTKRNDMSPNRKCSATSSSLGSLRNWKSYRKASYESAYYNYWRNHDRLSINRIWNAWLSYLGPAAASWIRRKHAASWISTLNAWIHFPGAISWHHASALCYVTWLTCGKMDGCPERRPPSKGPCPFNNWEETMTCVRVMEGVAALRSAYANNVTTLSVGILYSAIIWKREQTISCYLRYLSIRHRAISCIFLPHITTSIRKFTINFSIHFLYEFCVNIYFFTVAMVLMVTEVAEVKTVMVTTEAIATKVVVVAAAVEAEVSTIIIKDKAPVLTNIRTTTTVCIIFHIYTF